MDMVPLTPAIGARIDGVNLCEPPLAERSRAPIRNGSANPARCC
jgi:hypothetical protein